MTGGSASGHHQDGGRGGGHGRGPGRDRGGKRHARRESGGALPEPTTGTHAATPAPARPVLRFVVRFVAIIALFFAVTSVPWFWSTAMPWYLNANAQVAGAILSLAGESVHVTGSAVTTPRCSLDIQRGCDALDAIAIFGAAIVAFPAAGGLKLAGLVVGIPLLVVLNQVRILSLYVIGVVAPSAFELAHVEIWQPLFIALALVLWIVWVRWAMTRARRNAGAAQHPS